MTVAELIEELKKYPLDAVVAKTGRDGIHGLTSLYKMDYFDGYWTVEKPPEVVIGFDFNSFLFLFDDEE